MNEKYALFVWSSYALAFFALAWNLLTPRLRRSELRRLLAEAPESNE